ncbi:TATA box-binding protein-associated factor RNA polymerase I subunit C-like [Haematobia irritans]|uniref:TATA box-binding protein-associated factor RNA polymerase I subunit C-like n=1 Tax=Haematobia irritans TaxID=7368 RepID=UPI003F5066D0
MPKESRFFNISCNGSYKKRFRKQKCITDQQQVDTEKGGNGSEDEDGSQQNSNLKIHSQNSENRRKSIGMRCRRYNENNEIDRLLRCHSSYVRRQVTHSVLPSFNMGLWPQDELVTYPSCAFTLPRPIYIANGKQELIDLCHVRPMSRDLFRKRILKSRSSYHGAKKGKKSIKDYEKNGIYHSSVFDTAERLLTQPDPYFHGSYDYYYTGGNLCILPQSGKIVHATGSDLQTLEINEFPMPEDFTVTTSLSKVASKRLSEKCEIFEIKPMIPYNGSQKDSFIVRQRNLIHLNYLNKDNDIKVLAQFRTKSTPFISFSQSERDSNKLLLTTMKQHIRLYDINVDVPRLVQLFEIDPLNKKFSWNMIRPWRENTFLYCNNYEFCVIDVRTSPDQWMSSATSVITNDFLCDHITAIQPSAFNNLFYVATNHTLSCMDIRHIKTSSSYNEPEAVISRWSHQLQYSPLLLDTYRLRNAEYIALSSPLSGDLNICQLHRQKNDEKQIIQKSQREPKHIFKSPCLPYQPPTLLEAYDRARLEGHCLQPETNVKNRILACSTGLTFSEAALHDSQLPALGLILTSNSMGDIFLQALTKREANESDTRCSTQSTETIKDFAKKLSDQEEPLNYTHIENMKAMRKIFLCSFLNREIKEDVDAMDDSYSENDIANPIQPIKKKRKRLHLGRWQKSLSTLHSYKDALVPDLLSIWDIEMDNENDALRLGNLDGSSRVKPDPEKKVQNWLDINVCPPMVNIPNTNVSEIDTSIFLNQSQDIIDFENVVQSTQLINASTFDTTLHNNTTVNLDISKNSDVPLNTTSNSLDQSKKKKKAKKFVKGF